MHNIFILLAEESTRNTIVGAFVGVTALIFFLPLAVFLTVLCVCAYAGYRSERQRLSIYKTPVVNDSHPA